MIWVSLRLNPHRVTGKVEVRYFTGAFPQVSKHASLDDAEKGLIRSGVGQFALLSPHGGTPALLLSASS